LIKRNKAADAALTKIALASQQQPAKGKTRKLPPAKGKRQAKG
jgi:hypothetical protein